MKRKILAIALSLALLSSLFVFAAPVVAEPADQAGHFPVNFTIERVYNPSGQGYKLLGAPIDLTLPDKAPDGPEVTLHIEGRIVHRDTFVSYRVIDGDFGPDIGHMTTRSQDYPTEVNSTITVFMYNLKSLTGFWSSIEEYEFSDGSTATFKLEVKRSTAYWRNSATTTLPEWWNDAHVTFIGGTGVFENFHFTGTGGGWTADKILVCTGMGHMAPKN